MNTTAQQTPNLIDTEDVKNIVEPSTLELLLEELKKEGEVSFPFSLPTDALQEEDHMAALRKTGKEYTEQLGIIKTKIKSIDAQLNESSDVFWEAVGKGFTDDQVALYETSASSAYDTETKEIIMYMKDQYNA